MSKKQLGQFYTTNYDYILQHFIIPNPPLTIIEPFAGNGDLIEFVHKQERQNENVAKYNMECFDIDPKKEFILCKDTLLNPPNYNGKFVITNPPYLARNKSANKILFDKYEVNDLYKCFIKEISGQNCCLGGILIVPLNFFSSIRVADIQLRKTFLQKYNVIQLNIFEEKVFEDTTYTICSFQFALKSCIDDAKINIAIYPSNKQLQMELNENNHFMIGGEIYFLQQSIAYKITRLTAKNETAKNTNIVAKCIDDNFDNQISLSFVEDEKIYVDRTPNQSARTYATLVIEPAIDIEKQKKLVAKFNEFLAKYRQKYHSLFLANYRESKDIARKRISFDLVYNIVGHLLDEM